MSEKKKCKSCGAELDYNEDEEDEGDYCETCKLDGYAVRGTGGYKIYGSEEAGLY